MSKQPKEDPKAIPDPTNGGTGGLQEDGIITRLVPNPTDPPDVISLVGFLGRSPRPRFWRLYHTLDLKDYTEIAESDIVLSESLETKLQPLGGTVVWVKRGARLQHTRSESGQAETEFLQGGITGAFLTNTRQMVLNNEILRPIHTHPFGTWGCCSIRTCPSAEPALCPSGVRCLQANEF